MRETLDNQKKDIENAAKYLASKGWAEAGAGNISVAISYETRNQKLKLDTSFDSQENLNLLVTATGTRFRNLDSEDIGIVSVENNSLYHNFGSGKPTSELLSHLLIHTTKNSNKPRAVIHCHTTHTVTLTHMLRSELSEKLMKMHTEMEHYFPNGICCLDNHKPGSESLAHHTQRAFSSGFDFIVWPFHGVVSISNDLDGCIDKIEAVEKASRMLISIEGHTI